MWSNAEFVPLTRELYAREEDSSVSDDFNDPDECDIGPISFDLSELRLSGTPETLIITTYSDFPISVPHYNPIRHARTRIR